MICFVETEYSQIISFLVFLVKLKFCCFVADILIDQVENQRAFYSFCALLEHWK